MWYAKYLWWRPPCLLRTVIVNLRSDHTVAIRGVLWGYRGAWLTLKDPAVVRGDGPPAPVDGDVILHRDNVAFLQAL